MATSYYLLIAAGGFAGSFHCVGMCGGFACALGHNADGARTGIVRHLVYNSGRLVTYMFLGALAGAAGAGLSGAHATHAAHAAPGLLLDGSLGFMQRALSAAAGALMLIMALQLLGYLGRRHVTGGGFGASTFVTILGRLVRAPGLAAPLALGVANGFLPCPLVYAFALQATVAGTPLAGMLTMAAFGLGTFPAMLLMGGVGRLLAPAWRRRGVRVAATFILLLGIMTLLRGLLPITALHAHVQ